MRKILLVLALLFAMPAFASTTTVSGTIADSNGQIFANGTWTATLQSSTGATQGPFFVNGVQLTQSQTNISGSFDGTGAFSTTLTSNPSISPTGTLWSFKVCPAASSPCFTQTLNIFGASQDISTSIVPPPIAVNASQFGQPSAYQDSEIVGPILGFDYYNQTSQLLRLCTGNVPCTWVNVGAGGGGGGTITGSGTANNFTLWTGPTAIGNAPMNVAGGVNLSQNPFSINGPLLFPCTNAASGTSVNLLVTSDSNGNCITLPNGNTSRIEGVCFSGCGTSGTSQSAEFGPTPVLIDNQTAINDYIVAGANGQAHDAGSTYPTGVQVIGLALTVNAGAGTVATVNISILNILNSAGTSGISLQVNGTTTAGSFNNFGNTPSAQSNFLNVTWQTDNGAPTSNISAEVNYASTSQIGVIKLAQDLCGTGLLPTVCGIQNIPVTFASKATGDVLCLTSLTGIGNCKQGVPVLTPSTPYTSNASDRLTFQRLAGGSTFSFTLCQITGNCAFNMPIAFANNNSGLLTLTANAADKINNSATGGSYTALANTFTFLYQDSSSAPGNWWPATMPEITAFPACADSGGNHLNFTSAVGFTCGTSGSGTGTVTNIATTAPITGGPITSTGTIGVSNATTGAVGVVQLATDLAGTGTAPTVVSLEPAASVTANDCAGWFSSGSTSIKLQDQGPCGGSISGAPFGVHDIGTNTTYTIQTGDDKHVLTGEQTSTATYTLPQPASGSAAYVSQAVSTDCSTATTCAITITLTAGNAARFIFMCRCEGATPNFAVTDNKSDSYTTTLPITAVTGGGEHFFAAEAIAFNVTGGSTTITQTCTTCGAMSFEQQFVYALQYATLTGQDGTFSSSTGSATVPSVSTTTNFANDVVMETNLATFTCANETPSGFFQRVSAAGGFWPGGGGRSGTMNDSVIARPGIQNMTLTSSCANSWLMWSGAFRSTSSLNFLNGYSFTVRNSGTAPIVLTPTTSKIYTQWYAGLTSAQPVSVYPNQSVFCMSDGTNWQCKIDGPGVNANVAPVTVSGNISTPQNLMNATIKGNTLNQLGNAFHIFCGGNYSTEAANTSTLTFTLKLGTATLGTWTTAANLGGQTTKTWNIDMSFVSTATGTAGFKSHGLLSIAGIASATSDSSYNDTNTATTGTIDQTADEVLQLTITFSVAGAANGNIGIQDELIASQVN